MVKFEGRSSIVKRLSRNLKARVESYTKLEMLSVAEEGFLASSGAGRES